MRRFPSVRRNSAAIPSGDLTVRLADGREVNTTPEFVDANGKLFMYDDYIKGALIRRFPKDDNIPFYAFTLNQKADALFDKVGTWAKKGGTDPSELWGRYCKVEDYVSNSRLAALTMSELARCVDFPSTFPTLQEFSAAPDNNVSGDRWLKVTHYWRGFLAKNAVMDNWRWDGKYPTGSPLEYAALIAAFIKVAGVDPVVQRSKVSYLDTMPVNVLIAVSREWDKYLADPAFKSEADAILARSQQAEAERKAAWEARVKGTPASASSSYTTSSASSSMAPAATGSYSTPSTEITGMQYAQAMAINEALFGAKKNPMNYRLNGMNVARNPARGADRQRALSREMHELEENRELSRQEQARQAYLRELDKAKKNVHAEILEKGARLRDFVRSPSGSPFSTRASEQWVYRHAPDYGVKPKSMHEMFWKTLRDYHADEVVDYLVHKANSTSTGAAAELLGRSIDSAAEILASEAPRVTIQ